MPCANLFKISKAGRMGKLRVCAYVCVRVCVCKCVCKCVCVCVLRVCARLLCVKRVCLMLVASVLVVCGGEQHIFCLGSANLVYIHPPEGYPLLTL